MDFENRIKADFRNNNQKWAVDVGIEAEFPEAGIEEGYMTFTNEEILQCFRTRGEPNFGVSPEPDHRHSSTKPDVTKRTGGRWIWCFRISLPTDQASRTPSIPGQGCSTYGFRRCYR